MDTVTFESFLAQVRIGGRPCITGRSFTNAQVEAIRIAINELNDPAMENYFAVCIETRVRQ
jgi:transposase